MNDTTIASKAKAQLANFMGKVFTHFPKPSKRFVEECIYGIQASGDTKLSSIVRAIDDDIRPIYTEKRLSRNLDNEALKIVKAVYAATGGKGSVVYDRGGDRPAFYDYFIEGNRDFIVRLKGRSVLSWGGMHEVHDLARQCTMRHSHHIKFDSHGKECNVPISFGAMPVRLPPTVFCALCGNGSRARDYLYIGHLANDGGDPVAARGIPQSGSNISHPAMFQLRTLRCPNFAPCDASTSHPAKFRVRTLRSSGFAPCEVRKALGGSSPSACGLRPRWSWNSVGTHPA